MRHATLAMLLLCLFAPLAASAGEGNLVDPAWLEAHRTEVLILDASAPQVYAAGHVPGAVSVDIFGYGAQETPPAEMEKRLQSWGVDPARTIVVYDGGGTFLATRVFFTLAYHGFPIEKLKVLDGGFAKWQAAGLPVAKDASVPAPGSFKVSGPDEALRVRLPEVLQGSGDRENYVLLEALGPDWHYGQVAPFDRPGHIPNSVLLPAADFFNADKTFKSPDELRKMLAYMKVRPEQKVFSYCGGGIAASVPFFALKYILGFPSVELFIESELGWLKDERQLPHWTYDAPGVMRQAEWLASWNGKMMRMYGVSGISIVDVRTKEAYDEGHVPFAVNVPAETFRGRLASPAMLATALGAAGVDPALEAVIVSGAGITREAALAFALLEKIGQKKVSILIDSTEKSAARGLTMTKEPTIVGAPKTPADLAVRPVSYAANVRSGVIVPDAKSTRGVYPKVFLASGATLPSKPPAGTVIHVPYASLLNEDGTPKAAKDIWAILAKAGVSRYAEIVTVADDPADAAVNYYILKLMGWPDVKMLAEPAPGQVAQAAAKMCP
ncbi:MAG TPA: rhodanese-like domain-containing protein [Thermoanaerobaculia bacterium]|nr:rhodanese-like domain-containing protein [Thermoanaerobaculia bacterium]